MDPATLRAAVLTAPDAVILLVASLGFATIYAGYALGAGALTSWMERRGIGSTVDTRALAQGQVRAEILASLRSIVIFGGFGLLNVVLERAGVVHIDWRLDPVKLPLDLVVITLWNELHFYVCHRTLHHPWLYRHVHLEHHRSIRSTPWATYRFHWVEAVLLGSVMVTCLAWYPLGIGAIVLFPGVSLAMNALGHWNHEAVAPGHRWSWFWGATRRHAEHHQKVRGNYGFLFPQLDRWLGTTLTPKASRGP